MSAKTPDVLAAEELLAQLLSSKVGTDLLNLQAGSDIFKLTEPEDKVELAPDTPLTKRPARRATMTSSSHPFGTWNLSCLALNST